MVVCGKGQGGLKVPIGLQPNLTLTISETQRVNGIAKEYTIANVFLLAATLAANAWAIKVILRKEKIRINMLIVWDCGINMLTMVLLTFAYSPLLPLSSSSVAPCALLCFAMYTTLTWNHSILMLAL